MKTYYAIVDKRTREVVYGGSDGEVPFLALFDEKRHARQEKNKHSVFYGRCVVVKLRITEVKEPLPTPQKRTN